MKFYRVKPKYRRWVVGTKLYTPEERAKMKLVSRRCFEVLDVDIPESEAYNWVFSRLKHDNWEENKVKIKNGISIPNLKAKTIAWIRMNTGTGLSIVATTAPIATNAKYITERNCDKK